ncbi:MAG: hypothetical protein RBT49_13660 [Bacteroidales bacterium]|jgi:hypothetical protein|nr:hypothetical protein [Bacteroidales bacterium]
MKIILIVFILFGFIYPGKAQLTRESQKQFGKYIVKFNYSNVTGRSIVPDFTNQPVTLKEIFYTKNAYYGLEGLYVFNNFYSAGLYFGYANETFISNEQIESDSETTYYRMDRLGKSYFYGVNGELQLLPFLIKTDRLRFQMYFPVQFGLVSQCITTLKTNTTNWDKPVFEIGTGLGLGYNFIENIGIFGEYRFGRFYNQRNLQWKVGLNFSF